MHVYFHPSGSSINPADAEYDLNGTFSRTHSECPLSSMSCGCIPASDLIAEMLFMHITLEMGQLTNPADAEYDLKGTFSCIHSGHPASLLDPSDRMSETETDLPTSSATHALTPA